MPPDGGARCSRQPDADGVRISQRNYTCNANGDSSANGTQLIIWTCRGGTNQRWTPP